MKKITKIDKKNVNQIKDVLIKQKNEIVNIVTKNREGENDLLNNNVGDNIDIAADSSERELLFTLNDSERRRLENINIALEKIDKKTYGICEDCKKPISSQRLKAIPHTKFCIKCSTRNESY